MSDVEVSPWERWSAVPMRERKRVDRLAKRGQRHPDPAIAAAADGWAQVLLDANDRSDEPRVVRWVFNLADWANSIWWLFVPENLGEGSERRWARRILDAK